MDNEKNTVAYKSEQFAVRTIKLYKYLCEKFTLYALFNQFLRSGTSIGANIAEAENAISEKDFLSKMYIALKETSETKYWLRLFNKTEYLTDIQFESIYKDCVELEKMLTAITKTESKKLQGDNI